MHELNASDRARTQATTDGAIVVVTAKGRVVGASVLAPSAGEVIGELHHAVARRLRLEDLASIVRPYPTISTGITLLAAEAAFRRADKYRWLVRRR